MPLEGHGALLFLVAAKSRAVAPRWESLLAGGHRRDAEHAGVNAERTGVRGALNKRQHRLLYCEFGHRALKFTVGTQVFFGRI